MLLIVTDDQRWDTLDAMPVVQRELVSRGVTFSHSFVSNPLCCPSRASILTGNYSHTTGVYRQTTPYGAFPSFHDASTLATWMHDAGYRTGLFGKYIDAYQSDALNGYVPPGWDRWVAFVHSGYYTYGLTVDGEPEFHGEDPSTDYSTTVLGDAAERFILSAPEDQPLFAEFAPAAPHDPATPEPTFDGSFRDIAKWRPPSYDEADVSDKPAYMQALPRLTPRVDGMDRRPAPTAVRDAAERRRADRSPPRRAGGNRPPGEHADRLHLGQRPPVGRAPVDEEGGPLRRGAAGADGGAVRPHGRSSRAPTIT